jgi:hypothetical protein
VNKSLTLVVKQRPAALNKNVFSDPFTVTVSTLVFRGSHQDHCDEPLCSIRHIKTIAIFAIQTQNVLFPVGVERVGKRLVGNLDSSVYFRLLFDVGSDTGQVRPTSGLLDLS